MLVNPLYYREPMPRMPGTTPAGLGDLIAGGLIFNAVLAAPQIRTFYWQLKV